MESFLQCNGLFSPPNEKRNSAESFSPRILHVPEELEVVLQHKLPQVDGRVANVYAVVLKFEKK